MIDGVAPLRSKARPACGAIIAACIGVVSCVTTPEGPEGEPSLVSADIPVPSDTDLRDFSGARRDQFLEALAELRRGNARRARRSLEALQQEVAGSSVLRSAVALVDLSMGAIEAPRESLRREASKAEHSAFVQESYALAAEMAADFEEAYRAAEAAAVLLERARPERAAALRERAGRLRREAAQSYLARGKSLADDGDLAAAIAALEAGLEADDGDPELRTELVSRLIEAGSFDRAVEIVDAALEVFPDAPDLRKLAAAAYLKTGRLDEAKRLYTELVTASPQDADLRRGLDQVKAEIRRQNLPARYRDLRHMPQVTRAELAALLFETIEDLKGLRPVARGVVVTDVSGSWAKDYILMAVAQGLMDVYEDHTFGAEERVSRGDLADALARTVRRLEARPGALAPAEAYPAGEIDDLPRSHGRYDSIIMAVGYGLVEVGPDRAFRPADAATGREAVVGTERLAALASGER